MTTKTAHITSNYKRENKLSIYTNLDANLIRLSSLRKKKNKHKPAVLHNFSWLFWALPSRYTTCYRLLLQDVSYKASHALRSFSDLLCAPIWVLITPDSSTSALWLQQRHLVAKQGVCKKFPRISLTQYLCHTPQGFLTCRKILHRKADGFTSPPKEGVLQFFHHP
jgi:hypothetical protein